jgi:hypothetical protein
LLAEAMTNGNGVCSFDGNLNVDSAYTVCARRTGYVSHLEVYIPSIATDVDEDGGQVPTTFALNQNFPNPFNPTTTISFNLPTVSNVSLTIFNILGQEVTSVVNERLAAGNHVFEWDGHDGYGSPVASGIYFYRLEAGDYRSIRKMTLLK